MNEGTQKGSGDTVTVAELIEELKKVDQGLQIHIPHNTNVYDPLWLTMKEVFIIESEDGEDAVLCLSTKREDEGDFNEAQGRAEAEARAIADGLMDDYSE